MLDLEKGRYRCRIATTEAEVAAVQRLRWRAFRARQSLAPVPEGARDCDEFDGLCRHALIEEAGTGRLAACFRLMPLTGREIGASYSAQFYDLGALEAFDGRITEVGRFCLDPEARDADILRVAWGALTRHVDAEGVGMLIGCSSFLGTDVRAYYDSFAMLKARHLAPTRWLPRVKSEAVFRFAARLRRKPDQRRAFRQTPPLLRYYLSLGGWVSDHAVLDRELDTLHVFTALEIGAVPAARARALRLVAG
jgi:putative hemolysin